MARKEDQGPSEIDSIEICVIIFEGKSPSRYNWINWRIEDQFLFYFSCLIYQFI